MKKSAKKSPEVVELEPKSMDDQMRDVLQDLEKIRSEIKGEAAHGFLANAKFNLIKCFEHSE